MQAPDETLTDGRMVTLELAEWVAGLRYEDLPEPVVEEAGRALADYLGECLFVGATKPWGQSIASFAAADGGGTPEATIIATGERALASRAALANGLMALGFEYADYGGFSRLSPFAVTAPLVLADARHKTGKDLVRGIVVGYEVIVRVVAACMTPSRTAQTGFYVPAVVGTIGGAGGAAAVLGLSPRNTNYALGLACAFAGGTFQGHEEGAWQRSLNGGMAGERAVTAAQLGENGFRGSELGLEGVQGFAATFYNGRIDPDALLGGLGDSYAITERWTKAYPMNLTLHAPVEALLSIMRTHDLDFHDIDQIDAAWQKVEPFLGKHTIHSVVSAQASLPFALSVAAVRGKVTVDEFTDEALADPDVRAMIPRTTVHHDQELYKSVVNSQPGRVTVRLKDGREHTAEVLYPKGNPSNRMSEEEFRGKFTNMVDRVLGPEQSGELYDRVRALPDVADVAGVADWFSPRRR